MFHDYRHDAPPPSHKCDGEHQSERQRAGLYSISFKAPHTLPVKSGSDKSVLPDADRCFGAVIFVESQICMTIALVKNEHVILFKLR